MLSPRILSVLTGQASQVGEKSNVVSVLIALIGVLFVVVIFLVVYKAPSWVIASVLIAALVLCLFFVGAYTYCLIRDPDLLRSERMVLEKMAIERKFVGDSSSGKKNEEVLISSTVNSGTSQSEKLIEGVTENK